MPSLFRKPRQPARYIWDNTKVLQDIQNTEKSTDQSGPLEQQSHKIDRDFLSDERVCFMRGVCLLLIFWK